MEGAKFRAYIKGCVNMTPGPRGHIADNSAIDHSIVSEDNSHAIVSIYPNPTTGLVTIESSTEIEKIEVFDRLGVLHLANGGKQIQDKTMLDIQQIPAGIYFIKLTFKNKQTSVERLVKY